MGTEEGHRVVETRWRSLIKSGTGYILEVLVDTVILGVVLSLSGFRNPVEIGLGISLSIEFLCFLTHFGNERIWNKVKWGRKVEHVGNNKPGTR